MLTGRGADLIHEATGHEGFCLDALADILDINVAQCIKYLFFSLMEWVVVAKVIAQFLIGILVEVHIPNALIITKKRIMGRTEFYFRF